MFSYQKFAESKPKLLIAVILTTVGALSVPYTGRGPMSSIDLWKMLYKGKFFYRGNLRLVTSKSIKPTNKDGSIFLLTLSLNLETLDSST